LSILDEVERIVRDELDQLDTDYLRRAACKLLVLELFTRLQTNGNKVNHVFLTSSNHPVLLEIFNQTDDLEMSNDFITTLHESLRSMLNVSEDSLDLIIQSIIKPNEFVRNLYEEEEEQ
jgi:hypothetical protein